MSGDATTVGVIDQEVAGSSSTKDVATIPVTYVRSDGTLVTAHLQAAILTDQEGRPIDLVQIVPLLMEIRDLLKEANLAQLLRGDIL